MTAKPSRPRIGVVLLAAAALAAAAPSAAAAQATPRPAGRGQTSQPAPPARRPAPQKPAPAPTAKPPAPAAPVQAAAPAPPPPPAPEDLRFKTVYTAGEQKTESVTYKKGQRQRFEFVDTVLLKQADLKRTVQISRAANSYLVVPDGGAPAVAAPQAPAAAAAPGVVVVTSTFEDTGERKTAFGLQARRVKTTIDRQPMPGACDATKQRIETDAWYVDLPVTAQPAPPAVTAPPATCTDQIKASHSGDPKALGFPISYSMTMSVGDEKPNVVAMEITELEMTTLDPSLFEVPSGLTEAGDVRALSRALSDANEAKLAADVAGAGPVAPKVPGVLRVGVPEPVNKTTQAVDTRLLRARLVAELAAAKIEAEPLPAGSPEELLARSKDRGHDYLLVAEVTELKASKPGGIGGLLKAASSVAGGATKEATEAAVSIKLVQPDGKTRHSTNAKGKDGGFDMKAGLNLARFAGTMYMNMMTGRMMMNALSASMAGNLQGMGMLGNPGMFGMQAQAFSFGTGAMAPGMSGLVPGIDTGSGPGSGGMAMRMGGLDPTAGAASFLMQQAMAAESLGSTGLPGQPSFDAALDEAVKNAAKSVGDNLKRK
jgi:hypothetical protein